MSILNPVSGTTLDVNGVACGIRLRDDGSDAVVEEVPEDGGMTAAVEFTVPWEGRKDLMTALAGSSKLVGGVITRVPPWAYPENTSLFVRSIGQIRGIGPYRKASGFIGYRVAVVPAVFARPKWDFGTDSVRDPSGQPWTTTKIGITADVFTPAFGGTFFWLSGTGGGPLAGKPVPESSVSRIMPHAAISMTRHWMPYIPIEESMGFVGCVNLNPITIGNRTFPKGTLLYGGMNTSISMDTLGERTDEIEYILMGNYTQDWNAVIQTDGLFYRVNSKADGSGVYAYPYLDFWAGLP